jgi:hypothetical protein
MAVAWYVASFGATTKVFQAASASAAQSRYPTYTIAGPFASKAAAQAFAKGGSSAGTGSSGSSGSSGTGGAPGGCGPQAIYSALLAAGFSTVQAIGAMANAMNESGLNAETPAGDGGTSFGLWQFHNISYPDAPHPTGNCQQDIIAAVQYLKTHVSGSALQGSTGAEVAGNFAQYFEGCQGCQQGGSQWSQRVANAATVEGWISSGKWPTSSAGLSGSGGTSATLTSSSTRCLVGGNTFIPCLIDASQARGLIGGLLVGVGGILFLAGIGLVFAVSGAPGAAKVAASAARKVPAVRLTQDVARQTAAEPA